MVKCKIEYIHDQLIVNDLTIEYCEVERNNSDVLNTRCNPCKYKNVPITSRQHQEPLTGLRSFTRYRIKARAVNIVAKDRTEVATSYGDYSNPSYDETKEAGEELVFLKQVLIDSVLGNTVLIGQWANFVYVFFYGHQFATPTLPPKKYLGANDVITLFVHVSFRVLCNIADFRVWRQLIYTVADKWFI